VTFTSTRADHRSSRVPHPSHSSQEAGLVPGANGFWPTSDDPLYRLVGDGTTVVTSDHRMAWQEVRVY